MAARTIAHALFSWIENGQARLATHGQTVEIDDDVIAAYERHGVFEPEPVVTVEPAAPEPAAATPPPAHLVRPRAASNKAQWDEYASARGIDTAEMDKDEIIAAVERLDNEENDNG